MVSIDRKPVTVPAATVAPGASITVRIDASKAFSEREPGDIDFELDESRILYEDQSIIVVDKPSGLPSEATVVASRDHLHAAVKRYLWKVTQSRNEPYAGLLHRLDRETSGVIVLTKTREANAPLHAQFQNHDIQKEYIAVSSAVSPRYRQGMTFRLESKIGRVTAKSARGKWGVVDKDGDLAITDFEVLLTTKEWTTLRANPRTGRTHQIRVHLSSIGLPIAGDSLYGGATQVSGLPVARVLLHAESITFAHPITAIPLTIKAPLPAEFRPFLA